jgi:hypothetical protein
LEEPCRCACFAGGERGTEALPRWARLVPRRTPERKTWCRGELRERLGAGELKREKDLFNVFKTHLKIAVRPHLSTNKHTSTTYLPPLTGRPAHATPHVALSLVRARSLSQRWTGTYVIPSPFEHAGLCLRVRAIGSLSGLACRHTTAKQNASPPRQANGLLPRSRPALHTD